jgi:hypothetical protein
MSVHGTCETSTMSASLIGRSGSSAFRLSTTTVSMSLTGLLYGIGTKALPSWDFEDEVEQSVGRPCQTAGPNGHTISPHPSSREGHHSTAQWNSSFLLSHLILHGSHAAATSLVHRNSVPSTHMRCMITASRRANATIAFFSPRCLAIFIAQALSQDHLAERTSRIWAAS